MDEATYVEGFHYKSEVQKMTYRTLGQTGLRLSRLSLGGGPFGGLYETLKEDEAIQIIDEALRSGINYIDTAPWYGQGKSEAIIGKALKNIPRRSYYIGTKVGRYELDPEKMFDFSAQRIKKSVEESLKLLGLDYVDLIQIHDLEYAENLDQILFETLPALDQIVKAGKARFIGITGYPLNVLKKVVEKSSVRIDTVLSHCRCTLIDDELFHYVDFFKGKGMGIINAGVFAMGLLTPNAPPSWHPATKEIKDACQRAADYCDENDLDFAELAIKHSLRTDAVTSHLLGVGDLRFLNKNLKVATEGVTEQELAHINDLRKNFFLPISEKNWEKQIFPCKSFKKQTS